MSKLKSALAAGIIAASGMTGGGLIASTVVAAGFISTIGSAQAACTLGAKIDKSTAAEAKTKMQKAGFNQVRDLKKGCDNYWHGVAKKDGNETHVVLSPKGTVMTEGD